MVDVDPSEKTIRRFARIAFRRKWIVVIAILSAVVPTMMLAVLQDPVYQSSGDVLVDTSARDTLFGSGPGVYVNPDRTIQNKISVLESAQVFQRTQDLVGSSTAIPGVNGVVLPTNDLIEVRVQSGDASTAAALVDAYMESFAAVSREQAVSTLENAAQELQTKVSDLQAQIDDLDAAIAESSSDDDSGREADRRVLVDQQAGFKQTLSQLQVDAALETGGVQVLRPAAIPDDPIAPRPVRMAAIALLAGLMLGLAAAFILDLLDDSLSSPDDLVKLRRDTPLLGVVPVEAAATEGLPVSITRPDTLAVESYRALRTNIQFLGLERDMKVVQVTSSVAGEGKTTTAANLAVVLAQTGASVVLVDGDLRKPRVHRVFETDGTMGLTNNLVGETLDMTLTPVAENLWVILSGRVPPNPSEMLSGQHMTRFVEQLKARFDYVIIDSAPVLAVTDASALSRHADGVVLVVHAGRTSAPQVRRTLAALDQVNAPVLGVVLNRTAAKSLPNVDTYGYGYGPSAPEDKPRVLARRDG